MPVSISLRLCAVVIPPGERDQAASPRRATYLQDASSADQKKGRRPPSADAANLDQAAG
jgi:hypothetical protein